MTTPASARDLASSPLLNWGTAARGRAHSGDLRAHVVQSLMPTCRALPRRNQLLGRLGRGNAPGGRLLSGQSLPLVFTVVDVMTSFRAGRC